MVAIKRASTGILLILLLVGSVSALNLRIEVDQDRNLTVKGLEYENETQVQHVQMAMDNIGSVGCQYRLKAVSSYGNTTKKDYSDNYPMWPGTTKNAYMKFTAGNHSGNVNTSLYVSYCDGTEFLKNFTWESTNVGTISYVTSETREVSESGAKLDISWNKGTLVPIETPSYWKVPSAEIVNGSAELKYSPSIFKHTNLTYAVADQDGKIIGKTEVSLKEPEPTFREKLMGNKWAVPAGLLVVSLVGNLYLLRRKIVPDWLREKIDDFQLKNRGLKR